MGELAPRRKKSSSISSVDSFGSENDSNQHFVTDTAYKSYLNSLENWSGVLNVQVRDGSYPLHMAITAGASRHAIEMLVMACPEVLKMTDKHGRTPLYIYLTKGWFVDDEEMVKILLPEDDNAVARIPETRSGNLPLHAVAMYGGSLQVVKRVIDGYPDAVLAQNINKKTPYDLAMEYNQCPEDALAQLNAV
jgi:ankyrin repeat protein